MSFRLPGAKQTTGAVALLAVLALNFSAWYWRGFEPRIRIEKQSIKPLAFSPTGDVLTAGSQGMGGSIYWAPISPILFLSALDGTEAQPALVLNDNYQRPLSVAQAGYSPDGKLFSALHAHAYNELELSVFDQATRTRIGSQKVPIVESGSSGPDGTVTFRFSPDSSFIVTDGQVSRQGRFSHRTVVVWDLVARKERFALEKAGFPEVSPDSRLLATIEDPPLNVYGTKGSLKLWNTQSGKLERAIELPGAARMWPAFSPDGKLVAVNTGETTEVFETATGKRVFERKGWTPRFLADGITLMTVWRRDVQLWDTATWQLKQTHTFYLGNYWSRLDPIIPQTQVLGSRPLIAVVNGNSERHWRFLNWLGRAAHLNAFGSNQLFLVDASTGKRQTIEMHAAWMSGLSLWSSDGTRAALRFMDGSVELWDFPPRRSFVAPCLAAALTVMTVLLLLILRRRAGSAA